MKRIPFGANSSQFLPQTGGGTEGARPAADRAQSGPHATARITCPLLGIVDRHGKSRPPLEYPSFENQCLAAAEAQQIILTEQATFCLSSGHRDCPRFLAAAAAHPDRAPERAAAYPQAAPMPRPISSASVSPIDFEPYDSAEDDPLRALGASAPRLGEELRTPLRASPRSAARTRQWGWIGAAMIFVSTLLCGGIFAVYVGWQIANSSYMAVQPGTVDTLADLPPAQPQIYLVVTATSEASASTMDETQPQTGDQTSRTFDPGQLPQAVTPTPMSEGAPGTDGAIDGAAHMPPQTVSLGNPQGNPEGQPVAQQPAPNAQTSTDQPLSQQSFSQQSFTEPANPELDALQLEIPTRRPTPVLDIPTSTPMPDALALIPTPVPTVGTPLVLFSAEDTILESGDCTTISWTVENVRAVYFDSSGVDGHGQREVCMRDRTSNYLLTVMHVDGSHHYYTTTIEYLAPTPTPTPTYTFTPEPYLTPTWTPVPPTSTPTPNIQYGAALASQSGDVVQCQEDASCEVNLLVTNAGSEIDNITVQITGSVPWPAQLCRPDGVCGAPSLTIASMGPGNTALIRLVAQIPILEQSSQQSYTLRAVSDGSGQTIGSNTLNITLEAAPSGADASGGEEP